MAGISTKAAGGVTNKFKHNGKEEQRQEFADGAGLEWMDYGARMYDAQIGRWMTIDPKSEKFFEWSTYVYVLNNSLRYTDKDGREPNPIEPPTKTTVLQSMKQLYKDWAKAVENADKTLIAIESEYRIKAFYKREEAKAIQELIHPKYEEDPESIGSSSGGGGASGSYEYNSGIIPKKSKPYEPKTKFEKFVAVMDKKIDKLNSQADDYENTAESIAGTRDFLGKLTLEGLAKDAGKDFVMETFKEVRDNYEKLSEKEKKKFNVLQETKNTLIKKIMENFNPLLK